MRAAAPRASELARLARPAGEFDASRYFRGDRAISGFYNVGTAPMRALAQGDLPRASRHVDGRRCDGVRRRADRRSVSRGEGRRHRSRSPAIGATSRRGCCRAGSAGSRDDHSTNWATTDAICGSLIGPLLLAHPDAGPADVARGRSASQHVGAPRVGRRPDSAGAQRPGARSRRTTSRSALHADREDLIQKAVGWMLREAGKADRGAARTLPARERSASIPRTTFRYAIERFPQARTARAAER